MKDKEIEKIIVYTFLNHKDKWVSIPGLYRESGLPHRKIEEFIEHTDLLKRAKKKNRRGNIMYTLNDKARQIYQIEENDTKEIFKETKDLLLKGKLREGINEYFSILKGEKKLLPSQIQNLYKNNLISISTKYYQLEELWKLDQISTVQRFQESDKFIFKLYESILELEALIDELNKYRFKFKNVTIKIDRNYDNFKKTDEAQILNYVSTLLNLSNDEVKVKSVEKGSVIMTLEFDNTEQAENLFLLIKLGKLKEEGIFDARLKMLSEKLNLSNSINESKVATLCNEAKQLIKKGKAENAIDFLLENIQKIGEGFHNQLLLLSSDMNLLIEKSNLGLERADEIRIIRNKITYSLLNLIDKIKTKGLAS
ncbi:MAG: hypothetical protein MI974_06290 [Chitinophagales bacterium]|nr:hypothetical protein [Chitinophagales bacterium]